MCGDALRVYISADIEGMEGVVSKMQTLRSGQDYDLARKRLTEDVNSAIKAAFDLGAERVAVCDGHADMENLILEELNQEAEYISGAMRSSLQMQCIEEGFNALVVFGHSGAGQSVNGVLNHMYNSRKIYNVRLNGKIINTEAVCNAIIAGYYGIPLIAVIGDEAVNEEVKAFVPDVESIVVKRGISRYSAVSVSPIKARRMIYEGVTNALMRRDRIAPLKIDEPITMEIDYMDSGMADTACLVPNVVRLGPRTVSYTGNGPDIFRLQELLFFRLVDEFN